MMHFVTAKSILHSGGRMNLYRGCTHGCIYCDSRSTCYHMGHAFEDVEVKENALYLLEQTLRRRRSPMMLGTGSMTDPYIPLEKDLQYVKKTMELALRYGCGFTFITKSDLCLRDLDLMERLNRETKCVVQMTLTTADEKLCRIIEPNVATTARRLEVLNILRDHGIPTVVWLSPILPYINDTEENIRSILEMCIEAKAYGVLCFGMGLTLREGNREYFYAQLDRHFPGLKQQYIQEYGNNYSLPSTRSAALMELFHETCEKHGIVHTNDAIFRYLSDFTPKGMGEQLSLWNFE